MLKSAFFVPLCSNLSDMLLATPLPRTGLQSSAEDDEVPWQSKRQQATCKRDGSFCFVNVAEVQANQLIFLCAQSDRSPCTGCSRCHPSHHIICWPGRNILSDSLCLIRHPLKAHLLLLLLLLLLWKRLLRYLCHILQVRLTIVFSTVCL